MSKGELAVSSEMEKLQSALFFDDVPDTWTKLAYPSTYCLAIWCVSVSLSGSEQVSYLKECRGYILELFFFCFGYDLLY